MSIPIDITTIFDLRGYLIPQSQFALIVAIMGGYMAVAYKCWSIAMAKVVGIIYLFLALLSIVIICTYGIGPCNAVSKYTANYIILFIGLAFYVFGIHPFRNTRALLSEIAKDNEAYLSQCKELELGKVKLLAQEPSEEYIDRRAREEAIKNKAIYLILGSASAYILTKVAGYYL